MIVAKFVFLVGSGPEYLTYKIKSTAQLPVINVVTQSSIKDRRLHWATYSISLQVNTDS